MADEATACAPTPHVEPLPLQMVMQRGPNGIPGFTRMWAEIDKTWNQRLTVWEFRKFFQTVDVKLNGKVQLPHHPFRVYTHMGMPGVPGRDEMGV